MDHPRGRTRVVGRERAGVVYGSVGAGRERGDGAVLSGVLESNGWNRNATADQLGINRTTLYKKMKRLGLEDGRVGVM